MNNNLALLTNNITALYDEKKINNKEFNYILKRINDANRDFEELSKKSLRFELDECYKILYNIHDILDDFLYDDNEDEEDE